MNFENEKIAVLYGSQTGNAQDLAERIWRDSKRFYFRTAIKALDDFPFSELLTEQCIVLICSTTGQGEEPDNMKTFWRFMLKKSLTSTTLSNMQFAVFGLGDSSYAKFNFVAKRLYRRFLQLGAKPLIPLGLGDDQHDLGYDGAADPWIDNLWTTLLRIYPLPNDIKPLPSDYFIPPRWDVRTLHSPNTEVLVKQSIYKNIRKNTEFIATVVKNQRVTALDHFQDVRLITLETGEQSYGPGDVISLHPRNLPKQITKFQTVLSSNGVDIPPDTVFSLSQNDPEIPVPQVLKYNITFDQLCSEYFDLMSIPRRHTFRILAQITNSELEKEKCMEFASAEGQENFISYAYRPKRNIVEILADFPHATSNLTKEILFEILPPIKPRDFSIASNFQFCSNEVQILLAVVKYKTKLKEERLGLASNYLGSLEQGSELMARIKGGSLRFPQNPNKPIIMVGPGTGVAPFRNYIYERILDNNSNGENLVLFYGCRNREKDFLCKKEFENWHNQGKFSLFTAFSRDGPKKVYVQDKIIENKDFVWKILQQEASIFVAGNAKNMPQGVRKAFVDVCMESGRLKQTEANNYISNMEKTGRYQTECW